ncbi:unnamed protein product [Auanema sp. JU1783]|nr:unnamed protein product [Auanema sp. JU1783]
MRCLILLAFGLCCLLSVSAKMQNVTVQGVAVCNKKRVPNVKVQLWDKDTLDPNDLLGEVTTDSEGNFKVYGEEDEVGSIEPFLRIEHGCAVSKNGCIRTSEYIVPKEKIGGVYDMTYVTLDIKVHGDKEKC